MRVTVKRTRAISHAPSKGSYSVLMYVAVVIVKRRECEFEACARRSCIAISQDRGIGLGISIALSAKVLQNCLNLLLSGLNHLCHLNLAMRCVGSQQEVCRKVQLDKHSEEDPVLVSKMKTKNARCESLARSMPMNVYNPEKIR